MILINLHRIVAMFRKAIISSLTLITISLGATGNARAELSHQAIDLVNRPQQRIAQANDSRYRSMIYVQKGLQAQQQGNITDAVFNYYQAIEIDSMNPSAFMGIGMLLGETQEGILSVKTAALLYQSEGNRDGAKLAMSWLQLRGIIE